MNPQLRRMLFWSMIGVVLLVAIVAAFRPQPVMVDMATVERDRLTVTIQEEGKTRVHNVYTLSAPIKGYLRRVDAEVGDQVKISETILAQVEPLDSSFLDPRSEAQAKAEVQAAESAQILAQAEVRQAEAELEFALAEFNRMRELRLKGSVSASTLDNAERIYKSSRAILATKQAALQMRQYEKERAQALLVSPKTVKLPHGSCECLNITAPISGQVLKVLHKSEGVVNAGVPLVEIGSLEDLEIVVELLSTDAVSVQKGQKVLISNWGSDQPLEGVITQVEPVGFTKISALGIEEQRVNVIVAITSPFSVWQRLGHGYQVDVAIVLWEGENTLKVPLTALFREGHDWVVFKVKDGVVEKATVRLGQRNTRAAEVLSGIEEKDHIVLNPSDQVEEGVMVKSRDQFAG